MTNPSIAIEKQLQWHRAFCEEELVMSQRDKMHPEGYVVVETDARQHQWGKLIDGVLNEALETGDPFFWSAEICDLMNEVSKTIPEYVLQRESLPTPVGFFYFDKPITLANGHVIEGLAWATTNAKGSNETPEEKEVYRQRLHEQTYGQKIDADTNICIFVTIEHLHVYTPKGPYNKSSSGIIWSFGNDSSKPKQFIFTEAEENSATNEVDLIAACLTFLSQKILVTSTERPDRAARRRIEREKNPPINPLVRVVQLRKKNYASNDTRDSESERGGVEWSCRWIVRGFWRRQYYPTLGYHQPLYVMPYVKGPTDKPLKPSKATLYAVVR